MKVTCSLFSLTVLFLVSCTKLPEAQVTFHTQTAPGESKNMVFGYNWKGETLMMRRMPDFITKDFRSYRPFPAKDGQTYGAMFILEDTAAGRLRHFSNERRGKYMLSFINGKYSEEPIVIDREISDGTLVIWDGLSVRDLRSLDILMPRTGDDKDEWKKRSKEAQKALRETVKASKT